MKEIIIIGIAILLTGLLSGCIYSPSDESILKHFEVNEDYFIMDVSNSFVSGNECMYFVSIILQNRTTKEVITLHDFHYDDCEDKLYHGWYKGNSLDEKYGIIIN